MNAMIDMIIAAGITLKWTVFAAVGFIAVVLLLFCGARAIMSGVLSAKDQYKKKKEAGNE